MSTHVLPLGIYYGIFAALLVLTGITVGVAFLDLGPLNTVVALTIAAFKAVLVLLYFMHARYSSRLVWLCIGAGVLWFVLLIALTMADYESRGWV
jgi:cytochrome c oxidase subunit 4